MGVHTFYSNIMSNVISVGGKILQSGNNILRYGGLNNTFIYDGAIPFGTNTRVQQIAFDTDSGSDRIFFTDNSNRLWKGSYSNPFAGFTQVAGVNGFYVKVDKAGGRIFTVGGNNIYVLDYTNLTLLQTIAATSVAFFDIDRDGNRIIFCAGSNLYVYNYTTLVPGITIPKNLISSNSNFLANGIAIDKNGDRIFITDSNANALSIINYTDPTNGAFSSVPSSTIGLNNPRSIELDVLHNRIMVNGILIATGGGISIINYTNPNSGLSLVRQGLELNLCTGFGFDKIANQIWLFVASTPFQFLRLNNNFN